MKVNFDIVFDAKKQNKKRRKMIFSNQSKLQFKLEIDFQKKICKFFLVKT